MATPATTSPQIDSNWADGPFRLIEIPTKAKGDRPDHASLKLTFLMAGAHNFIIRGLNAILTCGPNVPTANDPGYKAQDVKDFLYYVAAWCKSVKHHHDAEEDYFFGWIENAAGQKGLLDTPVSQHAHFHDGMVRMMAYATATRPEEYAWHGAGGMKEVTDSFAHHLTEHLYAEIDMMFAMHIVDHEKLQKVIEDGDKRVINEITFDQFYDTMPLLLGCCDRTFPNSKAFPATPFFVPWVLSILNWRNGAWRFSPCNFWGQPKPLAFAPNAAVKGET